MQETLLEPPSSAVRSGCLRWPSDPWGGRRGRSGPPALLLRLAWGTLRQCMPTLHLFNHTSKLAGLFQGYLVPVKQHKILNFHDPENPWFSTISVLFFPSFPFRTAEGGLKTRATGGGHPSSHVVQRLPPKWDGRSWLKP